MHHPFRRAIVGAVLTVASLAGMATEAGAAKPGDGGVTAPACQSGDLMTLDVVASPATVTSGGRVTVSGAGRNCTVTTATVTVRKSATGPGGITSGCNIPAPTESQVTVAGGGTFSETQRFATSRSASCTGTYTATVEVIYLGSVIGSDSASFTVA